MTKSLTPAARERRRVRTPVLVVTAIAWLVTLTANPMASASTHSNNSMNMAMPPGSHMQMNHPSANTSGGSLLRFLGMWSLMLTAMMAPLLIGPLRHLGERSLSRRRPRAWLLFLASYAAIWIIGGFVLLAIADTLGRAGPPVALASVVLWQLSPVKQRCLNRHHARPAIAAFGGKADRDALRFGAVCAVWCFGSCWTLMLLPLIFMNAQLAVMAGVTLWIWAEQFDTPVAATWRLRLPSRALRVAASSTAPLLRTTSRVFAEA
jgi:predicted metal-binding membrane protein